MHKLDRLHEAHPDLSTIQIIAEAWKNMTFRYIAPLKEWDRKMVRMFPETVRKGELRRKALTPMEDGRARWGYPTTFPMGNPAGSWHPIAVAR